MIYHVRRHRSNSQSDLFSCEKPPELYICPHCYFKSDLSIVLKEHVIHLHKNEETEEVEDCNFSIYKCQTCKFQTLSVLVMLKHDTDGCRKTAKPPTFRRKRFECDQCPYSTFYKGNLTKHKINKHTNPEDIKWLECDSCSSKFKTSYNLRRHLKRRHEIKWFQCAQCQYKAKSNSNLRKHMCGKHWFECYKCDLKFQTADLLWYHVEQRHEIEWHQCAQCSFKTKCKGNLRRHTYSKHTDPSDLKWFQCANCSYKGTCENNLKRHVIRQHSKPGENAKFPCGQCSYVSQLKHHLSSHIISKHTSVENIKWHECARCSYKAKDKSNLRKHVYRKHSDKRDKVILM